MTSSPALLLAERQIIPPATTATDFGTFVVRRNTTFTGGAPGSVNACIRADSYVTAGVTNFEWAGVFVMHNSATSGQNVGSYSQGNKLSGAGATWGSVSEVIDFNTTSPTSSVVGIEVDVSANTTDPNSNRIIADLVYRRQGGVGAAMEASFGVRFNSTDVNAVLKTAIGFTAGAIVGIGIDFSPATLTSSAIKMAQGQNIQFNASVTPSVIRQLSYNGSSLNFTDTAGTTYFSFNDAGAIVIKGVQLIGARQTVTGSRSSGAALVSLLAALGAGGHGLITDSTTA